MQIILLPSNPLSSLNIIVVAESVSDRFESRFKVYLKVRSVMQCIALLVQRSQQTVQSKKTVVFKRV
jgi:hypothetical protein